jgi:hypothetical protein
MTLASLLWKEKIRVLVYVVLNSSSIGPRTNSPYAQAYNQINATIISIRIAWRERGCDFANFGIRIIWFEVTVEKIWTFDVLGAKLVFWKVTRVYLKFYINFGGYKCNLWKYEGLLWKIEGSRTDLQIPFENQELKCKICIYGWSAG